MRAQVFASTLALCLASGAKACYAQAVERNLPRSQPRAEVPIAGPALGLQDDATPLGPNLAALVLIGGTDEVALEPQAQKGVDLHGLEPLKGSDRQFEQFLGRPISQKLIADIGAAVLAIYRAQGRPLINISPPPQDISDGVLRIRVLEFVSGEIKVSGENPPTDAYLRARVRSPPGEVVNIRRLAEDLDWLNRYPFRAVTVAFSPAKRPGGVDLELQTQGSRPWRVSAGYANSGSPQTGVDRYFLAAQAALPGLHDAVASYQGTVSRDAIFGGGPIGENDAALYRSHGLNLSLPTGPRQSLEATLNSIQTNQPFEAFVAHTAIREATVVYRSALSNLLPGWRGDLALGLEVRQSLSEILFDSVAVNDARFDVYQGSLTYGWRGSGARGAAQVSTTIHVSPGNLNRYNTSARFTAYSSNRFSEARYAYGSLGATVQSRSFSLMTVDGFQVASSLAAQYAGDALPTTEQMGLGGAASVRGYTLDDGAFDRAAVLRSELRHRSSGRTGGDSAVTTNLFVDLGYGRANADQSEGSVAAVGAGAAYRLGQRVDLSFDVALPLKDLGGTRSGDARLEALLAVSF
jgi:hemolysin activation/secretion protein